MPLMLERRLVIPGRGRELARIVAYNPNHDEQGRFAEGDGGGDEDLPEVLPLSEHEEKLHEAGKWTPAKTPSAAAEWSKTSAVTETLYHGTSVDVAEKIKGEGFNTGRSAFGTGVYLAVDKSFAEAYQRGANEGKGAVVETKINVEKMLPITDSPKGYDAAAKSLGLSKSEFAAMTKANLPSTNGSQLQAMGEAIRLAAERQGFQGLKVNSSKPFYVVFDPKRVTSIERSVKAFNPRINDRREMFSRTKIQAYNENHDELGRFSDSDGSGSSGHELNEEAGRLAREIIQIGNAGRKAYKPRAKEFSERAASLEKRAGESVEKMSKDELAQAAKDVLGLTPPKSWSREQTSKAILKSIRDRVGAAMRSNI